MLVLAAAGSPGPGQAGALSLLIIGFLVVVCAFLFRSMARHLRKVPSSFERPGQPPDQAAQTEARRTDEAGEAGSTPQP